MRKLVLLSIAVCAFAGLLAVSAAGEMRGLWVDGFHQGFRTPTQTEAMVAKAKACNFNAIFVEVRRRGDVYFDSKIEPMAIDAEPGYDPLADIVAKAHAAGLQVHAWIPAFEIGHENRWSKSKGQLQQAHPDWLMKDHMGSTKFYEDRYYLDPGVPGVRKHIVGLVDEVVRKYDVDGIHLDVVRYPGYNGGYSDTSLALFAKEKGKSNRPALNDQDWSDWRRAQVTQFVREVYAAAKQGKSGVKVSASVFANIKDAYNDKFQDWVGWLNEGILDFAVPMVFPQDNQVFQSMVSEMVSAAGSHPVYIGQGGYKMGAANGLAQVEIAKQAGAGGVLVYSYYYCKDPQKGEQISLMDALKSGPYATADGEVAKSE